MKKLSVVIPMYYEEEVAQKCYERIKNVCINLEDMDYELIFVDDGSKDKTLHILKDILEMDDKVKVLSFSRNFGHQAAVTAGLKEVTGDVVCVIDADLQDPPECIVEMLKLWQDGADVVYAKRKTREGESFFKLFTAKAFYKFLSKMSEVDIPKDTGDFRLVDRKVIDEINKMPEHNKFLRGLFSWLGFNQVAYEYERRERIDGKTKYSLKKMLKLASDGIFGFSYTPIRILGKVGVLFGILSILTVIYSVIKLICNLEFLSYPCLLIIFMATFCTSNIILGMWVLGKYMARIHDEVMKRPQYVINEKLNVE